MGLAYIWKAGTSGDWFSSAWGKAPPTKKDTAVLTSTPGSSAYDVTVSANENVAVDTLDVAADYANGGLITLTIDGVMTVNTLEYDPNTAIGSRIIVEQGGVFTINKSISDRAGFCETIDLDGGTLNFGSKNADIANVTVSFDYHSGGTFNFDYDVSKGIHTLVTGFTDGDRISFSNLNLTGDTYCYDGDVLTVYSGTKVVLSIHVQGNQTKFKLEGSSIEGCVCYAAGTYIATPEGEARVEDLKVGDLVMTLSDGKHVAQPIKWVGHRTLNLVSHPQPGKVAPVRIRAGAFGDQMPHRDLLVSPDHAIFVDGKLICARQLINHMTIVPETGWSAVTYYHIELDAHSVLLAEGLPAESYLNTGNDGFFANSGGVTTLHPDLTDETDYPTREAGSVAPFVWEEESVRPVWETLADRATMLGYVRPRRDGTTDAQIRIQAHGRTLRPTHANDGTFAFVVPAGTQFVRLRSRAEAPTCAKPWLEDRRVLGVYVQRITLRDLSTNELWDIPLDQPSLSQGWHDVERDGLGLRRWTDGEAVVPLPDTEGMMLLTLQADTGGITYLADDAELAA